MTDRKAFYEERAASRPAELKRHYHRLLQNYFSFLVPPNVSVLDIGCGPGDLLAAVKPARGVGVDFSPRMIDLARAEHPEFEFHVADATGFTSEEKFDYIIASELVNDLPDVQKFFEHIRRNATSDTRLVLNFFNNLWRPFLSMAQKL
ncbi:MAG TPA: class I SAM-dependent methyltransferase, partial [Burkholderiales bacterium]|nr:class I SAM-dependent methyltransferase [Burkholderiales bacterium]